jgi:alkaline phosphatase D
MPITRRSLLGLMSSSTFILAASSKVAIATALPEHQPALSFKQGVASADPQPNAVMLWTRAEPQNGAKKTALLVQVSTDSQFSTVIVDALLNTDIESDYTVRSYITGLQSDTAYYYRFIGAGQSVSRLGQTRTAPAIDQEKNVNLAFVSCQSFEQSYYGAWARMLSDDRSAPAEKQIQFVLHLGDFIYERSWHKAYDGGPQPRYVPKFPDGVPGEHSRHAISLADYRHLYKTYLSDPHLQEARARWPFISIWDDHEFSNDNFQSFSTYGDASKLEAQRKLDSNQAWFEYIPTVLGDLPSQSAHDFKPAKLASNDSADNASAVGSLCIYRKLSWGKHLDIVLTDTRSYRSGPCVSSELAESVGLPLNSLKLIDIADGGLAYNNGEPPGFLPYGDGKTPNPGRHRLPGTCLGLTQRDWFLSALNSSEATWKLWGNALPLMPLNIDLSTLPLSDYEDSVVNIDAWAGYPGEMRFLMSYIHEQQVPGVVSLSGDHHMHGASTISWSTTDPDAKPVAADFACAGISSSPFFDSIVDATKDSGPEFRQMVYLEEDGELTPVWHMTMLQGALAAFTYAKTGMENVASWLGPNDANPGLKYVDTTANGYGLAQFSAREMNVQMVSMEDLRKPFETPPQIKQTAEFRIAAWSAGDHPVLEGPKFAGRPPFPFSVDAV